MDKQTILNKIVSLKRCIDRIENKIPATSQKLQSDLDLQDIVSLNLQKALKQLTDAVDLLRQRLFFQIAPALHPQPLLFLI